ncbi:DUF4041 domain-containing protein [Vibrio sp. HN007]|uniref:DUF4041 domain-containing protein n=1 Tax=Vibrio iocasae TaxID=3098914 RepID=UPI0035D3F96F
MEQFSTLQVVYAALVVIAVLILIGWVLNSRSKKELNKAKNKITSTEDQLQQSKKVVESVISQLSEYEEKYSIIINIESEHQKLKSEFESERSDLENQITNLRTDYKSKKSTYDALAKQVAIFDEDIELIELGFYKPRFDFDTTEAFKEKIKQCKERQKELMRNKSSQGAIYCYRDWTVDGSRVEGKKMTNKGIRLTARAFNNECEAAIANCTWRNVAKMEERVKKAFDSINQLNESNAIRITEHYLNAKLTELQLTYEYHEKKQIEKEEQAEIKAQMREEARIEAEIRKAEAEAIKEEKRYQKALDIARKELVKASDDMKQELEEQIAQLQFDLEEAELKHQRAQSMAEQTKQGHVYIISNIGSFGEGVYKIGMTRRLEPMDRVKELGDASVPFTFDVHAMIHTKDAPSLEKKLHDQFDSRRLNMINRRKEFFHVSLDEIKEVVHDFTENAVEFIETAVAKDYHETQAIKKQQLLMEDKLAAEKLEISSKVPEFAEEI